MNSIMLVPRKELSARLPGTVFLKITRLNTPRKLLSLNVVSLISSLRVGKRHFLASPLLTLLLLPASCQKAS
jgi:hypothetical protein